jgi:hypothetical protein
MSMSSKPERPTMLPAVPGSVSAVPRPVNSKTLVILARTFLPSEWRMTKTGRRPWRPAEDLADGDPADVVAPVDVGDEHVEGLVRLGERGRDVVEDRLEEGDMSFFSSPRWYIM